MSVSLICFISLHASQPILVAPEEKSVFRLGLMTMKKTLLTKGIVTEKEQSMLSEAFVKLDELEEICGFFRNTLAAGIKALALKSCMCRTRSSYFF